MSAVQWDPATDSDKALKEAFSQLNASNDKVVIREAGRPNRFVLHTRGYHDLSAFIMSGNTFPSSPNEFEAKIPKSALKKLNEIDPDIYERTKHTMSLIGSSCGEFYNNHSPKLVTVASRAINYSDSTVELMDEAEEINLRHSLEILLDPKYQSASDKDGTFADARESAQMVLEMLKQEAYDGKRQVDEIIGSVLRFKEVTMRLLEDVKFLTKQFHTGPASNPSGETRSYLEFLNGELSKTIKDFEATLKQAIDRNGGWQNAGSAIVAARAGPLGFVTLTIDATRDAELRRGWDRLEQQIDTAARDREEETELVKLVSMMVYQYSDIESKMTTAINALNELAALFQVQSDCYSKIRGALDTISTGTGRDSAATRRAFVIFQTKETVRKFRELKDVAGEFIRGAVNQTRL